MRASLAPPRSSFEVWRLAPAGNRGAVVVFRGNTLAIAKGWIAKAKVVSVGRIWIAQLGLRAHGPPKPTITVNRLHAELTAMLSHLGLKVVWAGPAKQRYPRVVPIETPVLEAT